MCPPNGKSSRSLTISGALNRRMPPACVQTSVSVEFDTQTFPKLKDIKHMSQFCASPTTNGRSAYDVVAEVLANNREVASATVYLVETEAVADETKHHRQVQRHSDAALHLRKQYGIPFWQAVLLCADGAGEAVDEDILRAALYHRRDNGLKHPRKVMNDDTTLSMLLDLDRSIGENQSLVLSSEVITHEGAILHIPMIDFRLSVGAEHALTATRAVATLNQGGYLLRSGQSYHFYGDNLFTAEELTQFLARTLFLTPLVDHRWVAHQLMEGRCGLRISRGFGGRPAPELI